VLLNIIVENNC